MEQMTLTAKVQIVASDEEKALLDKTMFVYRDACNYVSGYCRNFQQNDDTFRVNLYRKADKIKKKNQKI